MRFQIVLLVLISCLTLPSLTKIALNPFVDLTIGKFEEATFGGGCFWCTEAIFERIPGVAQVESGYSGGHVVNPTYQQVKQGNTGHAEVIRITYNPNIVSYEKLVDAFFHSHDPTLLNRQGVDVGHQYRSVIFYHNEHQRIIAQKVMRYLEENFVFAGPIMTELAPLINYYPAEDYHQNYFDAMKNDQFVTIDTFDISYKIDKFFSKYENQTTQESLIPETQPNASNSPKKKLLADVQIIRSANPFHPWHNLTYGGGAPEKVQVVIEVSKGSRAKYEVDKATGYLKLDRVTEEAYPYPINYGFIPQTLYGDGDPLDVLVLSSVDLQPMSTVQARVIGVFNMVDSDEEDDKILTVVDKDPQLSHIQDLSDVDGELVKEIKIYFENYKKFENKIVKINSIKDKQEAFYCIKEGIQLYRDFYVYSS